MTTLSDVRDFLAVHRLAVVGVSRNPRDFTRTLFRELLAQGYDAVPVNPGIGEIEGLPCYASVADISPPVEGALLLTTPEASEEVVRECAAAGIRRVWFYRAFGRGAVHRGASALCAQKGIRVVEGECPFMFLPDAAWIHRGHGMCRKLLGRYPQ